MNDATDPSPVPGALVVAGPLTEADRAVLADAFRPLDSLAPGIAGTLVQYVDTGHEPFALETLAGLGAEALRALNLKSDYHQRLNPADERPAWRRWLVEERRHEAAVLLRLVKVITAPPPSQPRISVVVQAFSKDRGEHLRPLGAPDWLEPLLWEFLFGQHVSCARIIGDNRLSADLVEDLLRADGFPSDLVYRPAFPASDVSQATMAQMLLGGLKGYAKGLLRHPEIVLEALSREPAAERIRALESFQEYQLPVAPFLECLARMAVCPARKVREMAGPLVSDAGVDALPPLRALAESGSTEERRNAVLAIGRIGTAEAVAALRERSSAERSSKVKAALSELLAETTRDPVGDDARPLPPIDVFRDVSLAGEVKEALADIATEALEGIAAGNVPRYFGSPVKAVDADAIERGFALLVQPTPWSESPEPIWQALRWVTTDAFFAFLKRPELTPLHAVRLLCLTGDLREDGRHGGLIYFDYDTPLRAYRDAHEPPLDLRVLGAAFRASALRDTSIARHRLQPEGFRRFDWPDEATWPYFAEHLDWLETAFTSSPKRRFEYGLYPHPQLRQAILTILATFPAPPQRFLDLLWGVALGASKAERPLAQRCLEKLPGHVDKVLAALTGGRQEARIAAAEWAARLRPAGLVDTLEQALRVERSEAVRDALLDALQKAGGGTQKTSVPIVGAASDPRAELASEASKGWKSGVPKKLDWFPFDHLPEVRWRADDAPLERDSLTWLVVQAWKAKSPEPGAVLRGRASLFRREDALRLGDFVLDAWLARDLRPPSEEVVRKRTLEWDQTYGQLAQLPAYQEMFEKLQEVREAQIHQPEGNATADKGVLAVVAACGASTAALKVRSYLDEWYGTRVHSCRALVQMLAWLDQPDAVEVLLAVSKRFRTKSIRDEAETQARRLAGRKGVTLSELADQALPDLGLDGEGRLALDFGDRQFVARLDDDAEVILEDGEGNRIASLPAPRKADDAEKAAQAKKALTALKGRVKALRKTVAERLYEAMCTQRDWRFADWQATLQAHPLAGRLCRRLVWSTEGGTTFRPLEDGTLTDTTDAEVQVAPDAMVRLAHALTVPEAEARRWHEHLADYEVSPLFDQFSNLAYRLPDALRTETRLEQAVTGAAKLPALQRLTRGRGYDPLAFRYEDGGYRQVKHFPGAGLQAAIDIELRDEEGPAQSLTLSFLPMKGASTGRPLGEVPPVLLSECRADLLVVAGSAGIVEE